MKGKLAFVAAVMTLGGGGNAAAQGAQAPFVRIAELSIDPAQLDAYRAAVTEEITQSVRTEPGVLAIYAVAEKDHPSKFHLLEIYRDHAGYEAHVRSPHFLRYKTATEQMVKSLTLLDAEPVALIGKTE